MAWLADHGPRKKKKKKKKKKNRSNPIPEIGRKYMYEEGKCLTKWTMKNY